MSLYLVVCRSADVESEQIDFIDSCVGEEEEEEGRSRGRGAGGGDGTSLSSQFMAYIERRITREVQAPPRVMMTSRCVFYQADLCPDRLGAGSLSSHQ